MAKIALYQKYRSSNFDEVVGQEHIVKSIKNAIEQDKVTHAYLFCGPRGTGKTTMARILAKAVNCENKEKAPCEKCDNCLAANAGTHPDIIEINGASETHVEDVREIIERSRLAPMQGEHKIYIIDEVHQLSSAASSALLKTLEEPPTNVIFILATTDPQKILPTIISRCQRYDFTKVQTNQIKKHLLYVAKEEGIALEEDAAKTIAILADGGMRDALSILEQCASYALDNITTEEVDRIYGLSTTEEKIGLLTDVLDSNYENLLSRIQSYEENGVDMPRYTEGLIDILKDAVIFTHTKKQDLLKTIDANTAADILEKCNEDTCMHIIEDLVDAKEKFKTSTSSKSCFEVICLTLTNRYGQRESHASMKKEAPEENHASMNKEKTKKKQKENDLDIEKILRLLVQCDKKEKVEFEKAYQDALNSSDLENKKFTSLLKDITIAAAGKDCAILVGKENAIIERINEEEMNEGIYCFLNKITGSERMLFAIDNEVFKEATELYRQKMKNNELPEAVEIEKYVIENTKKTPEEKVMELFGEENVEVIGG